MQLGLVNIKIITKQAITMFESYEVLLHLLQTDLLNL